MNRIACLPVAPNIACYCVKITPIVVSLRAALNWGWSIRRDINDCLTSWLILTVRAVATAIAANRGVRGDIYLRRPEVQWEQLVSLDPLLGSISPAAVEQVIYDIRYEGYIDRQQGEIDKRKRHAEKRIPATFDFAAIHSLRAEAKQKLTAIRPVTIDQAQRISGITPATLPW